MDDVIKLLDWLFSGFWRFTGVMMILTVISRFRLVTVKTGNAPKEDESE